MEQRIEVKVFKTKMVCDRCQKGEMIPTGGVNHAAPPKYGHRCNNLSCNFFSEFKEIYPKIVYGEI